MPRSSSKSKKAPDGMGSIRKVERTIKGKTYTYFEARYSVGFDPGTGKQIQRSISGKSKTEVAKKLREALTAVDAGMYVEPNRMTLSEWLDQWSADYLVGIKPLTVSSYVTCIQNHLKPGLGAVRLQDLDTRTIQRFYNGLGVPVSNRDALSPKTVANIHGVLHAALQQAVTNRYIPFNPSDATKLPRIEAHEIKPLDEVETKLFWQSVKGDSFENLFKVTFLTGMRQGEALGLTWDCVDFEQGSILINKQLQKEKKVDGQFRLVSLKNDKPRKLTPAPLVMQLLKERKLEQQEQQEKAGEAWSNPMNLVYTMPLGSHLIPQTVVRHYKKCVSSIGRPDARFHDLRHSYAVASIRRGDGPKELQAALGHHSPSFSLSVYGHVTDQMQQASAARMENYIKGVLGE